jgi:uncharacterized membrane protein (UPF0127 family)
MSWLIRDSDVLASLEVAESFGARIRGLIGRDGVDGAMLLPRARSVHTIGMRFTVDVAFCDKNLVVLRTRVMRPFRVGRLVPRAACVVEAEAGAFERWRLRPGDQLEIG